MAFGRQLLAVKICSCPKRDKQKEENHNVEEERKFEGVSTSTTPNLVCTRNTESGVGHSADDVVRDVRVSPVTVLSVGLIAVVNFRRRLYIFIFYCILVGMGDLGLKLTKN